MHSDEQAIREMVSTWLEASQAHDTETVLNLMTDDVIFLGCGRPPMRGKSDFSASQSALAGASIEARSEIQEINVFGEWAYIWTNLTVVITPENGRPMKRSGNTLSILKKENGVWRIARDANMLAPDQAEETQGNG
jgi:uncharacterized protein (TIGR02246 family)